MEEWVKISALLCVFGFLKEFRPAEPYITKYLTNPPMNFTIDDVSNDLYPLGTYTTMASLVVVFLITDLVRYKPVIIFDGICGMGAYFLLITFRTIALARVAEVFYGLFMACEVAYYTYIYAKVDKSHYQQVSGHTRAAYLVGRSFSGIASQLFISAFSSSYYTLTVLTFGGTTAATLWACFLPPVSASIYFSKPAKEDSVTLEQGTSRTSTVLSKYGKSFNHLLKDFYAAFSNPYILKWMFWWSLATCGYYQVLSYVQVLWEQILMEGNTTVNSQWNGAVEAIYTLLSAGASFGCGLLVLNWKIYGESVLCVCSLLIAILLYLMSQTNQIITGYVTYILYTIAYNGMITIANSEIATYLNPDSHGLIFGFTLFLALVFQSVLTFSVSFLTDERIKFVVYSSYFAVLGLSFALIASLKIIRHYAQKKTVEVVSLENRSEVLRLRTPSEDAKI